MSDHHEITPWLQVYTDEAVGDLSPLSISISSGIVVDVAGPSDNGGMHSYIVGFMSRNLLSPLDAPLAANL